MSGSPVQSDEYLVQPVQIQNDQLIIAETFHPSQTQTHSQPSPALLGSQPATRNLNVFECAYDNTIISSQN